MKIGIVTIHNADNYGAVLQAYALKSFIQQQNEQFKVKTIDYNNINVTKRYNLVRTGLKPYEMLKSFHDILMINKRRNKRNKFKQFRVDNLNLTASEYFDIDQLNNSHEKFDIYISGSDQVWNPSQSNHCINGIYYLDFAPEDAKRISYASSFGHYEFTTEQKKQIKRYLNKYTFISCRESDGIELIHEITPKKVEQVLDPVFLLKKSEWEKLLINNESKEKYLLVYTLGYDKDAFEIARKVAQDKQLKIYYLSLNLLANKRVVDRLITDAGPIEFLELFFGASYIVTNSFHGTVFSIVFNKDFVTIPPNNKINRGNRVKSLLSLLNLEDRIISKADELEKIPLDTDYILSNVHLQRHREKSVAYLIDALKQSSYVVG